VVSGKGGVGKSSVTASLVVLLSRAGLRVATVDSDVDAPNLSIILGVDLFDFKGVQASEKASIDFTKCDGCGSCVSACKIDALIDGKGEPRRWCASCARGAELAHLCAPGRQ